MDTTGAHYYRYRYTDNILKGGLLGTKLKGKYIDIMKKDGKMIKDSRGNVLGEILIDLIIKNEPPYELVGTLYRFNEI